MAHTKAKGTTKLGRDSESKRLGVKIFGGSPIKCGQIIIRQRGTAYTPGENVKRGNDDTLYATCDGIVSYREVSRIAFTGNRRKKQIVSVKANEKSKVKIENNKKRVSSGGVQAAFDQEKINIIEKEAESREALSKNSESKIIKQEEPIKMITRKEVKKSPRKK